jgi:hypothetical protein
MSDIRQTLSGDGLTKADAERVLELADGYLEDAENVLWNASKVADRDDLATELEALTRSIWNLQHQVDDLRRTLEDEDQ